MEYKTRYPLKNLELIVLTMRKAIIRSVVNDKKIPITYLRNYFKIKDKYLTQLERGGNYGK